MKFGAAASIAVFPYIIFNFRFKANESDSFALNLDIARQNQMKKDFAIIFFGDNHGNIKGAHLFKRRICSHNDRYVRIYFIVQRTRCDLTANRE